MSTVTAAKEYGTFFETLRKETPLKAYEQLFSKEVYFEDPFQKISGLDNLYGLFQHMFETLHAPRFVIDEIVVEGQTVYLRWHFFYQRSSNAQQTQFEGVSRVLFDTTDKVFSHIDYWDAAANVYENLPLLGTLLSWLKRRIAYTGESHRHMSDTLYHR